MTMNKFSVVTQLLRKCNKFNNGVENVEIELKYDIIKLENRQIVINFSTLNQLTKKWEPKDRKWKILNNIKRY